MAKIKTEQQKALDQAMDIIINSGADLSNMFKEGGLLKQLTKNLVERALKAELDDHLGYDKYEHSNDIVNSRNGVSKKNLITNNGVIELEVPRDRDSSFEPMLVPKRTTRLEGLDDKIISLYAKGMSVHDIKIQLEELYGGAEISTGLISKITNEVMDEVIVWQNRQLEPIYPIVFFDCLFVYVRHEKSVIKKAVYVALGIDANGRKDVLGLWMSINEGAKFWLSNFTELKNRGVQDILIACTDNLAGMNEAITAVFPKTDHQLCIVHQIRNSLKFVSYKDYKKVTADLKKVYTAPTEEMALFALDEFAKIWDSPGIKLTHTLLNLGILIGII